MSTLPADPPFAHALTDLEGRFLTVDDGFCELLRRERSGIIRRTILDLTVEPDRPLNAEKLNRLRESGTPFVIRKLYLRGDGGTQAVENSVSMLTDGIGGGVLAASVKPLANATDHSFAASIRIGRILLGEQKARLALGSALQGLDGRLILTAYLLEAEGAAVWASELAETAGGDAQTNLLRIWELVKAEALTVDGDARSLERASVRVSLDLAKRLERHLAGTLARGNQS